MILFTLNLKSLECHLERGVSINFNFYSTSLDTDKGRVDGLSSNLCYDFVK